MKIARKRRKRMERARKRARLKTNPHHGVKPKLRTVLQVAEKMET
jgi:hypothetical protein